MYKLPETEDYKIEIGNKFLNQELAEWVDASCYYVVNKGTGVIEFMSAYLPSVVYTMRSMQGFLDKDIKSEGTYREPALEGGEPPSIFQ